MSNIAADITRIPALRDGSLVTPFIDLTDALTRAQELAAPYTSTVQVNIYLTAGSHYLLRDRGDSAEAYVQQDFYDPVNLNYEVYISPVGCLPSSTSCTAAQATVFNKRRDGLVFDVPAKFHMRNIKIDSLDSILPSATACLGLRRSCCT